MKSSLSNLAQRLLPRQLRDWLGAQMYRYRFRPPLGKVNFGDLRRLSPISRQFGFDRGLPVDRYYIEQFLGDQASSIRGRVLEIGDNTYTVQFGADRVTQSDVLHLTEGNPKATFVGDLSDAPHLPSDAFDCVVLVQTLQFIYDFKAAVDTVRRILKPGGTLLATFPGISQKSEDLWQDYWCWSFTTTSARRMFTEAFPQAEVKIEVYGNVLSTIALLQGIAAQELRPEELEHRDPDYDVLIAVQVTKN